MPSVLELLGAGYTYDQISSTINQAEGDIKSAISDAETDITSYLDPYVQTGIGAIDKYNALLDDRPDFTLDIPSWEGYAPGDLSLPEWSGYDPGTLRFDQTLDLPSWEQYDPGALDMPSWSQYDPGAWDSTISLAELEQTPGYQFRLQQGIQGLERSAAAGPRSR